MVGLQFRQAALLAAVGLDSKASGQGMCEYPSWPLKALVCWPSQRKAAQERKAPLSLDGSQRAAPQSRPLPPPPCCLPRAALPLVPSPHAGAMHPLSSEVVKACLPDGQRKPFRHNMMALMTVTGAKGSVVNFSQVCFTHVLIGFIYLWQSRPCLPD